MGLGKRLQRRHVDATGVDGADDVLAQTDAVEAEVGLEEQHRDEVGPVFAVGRRGAVLCHQREDAVDLSGAVF